DDRVALAEVLADRAGLPERRRVESRDLVAPLRPLTGGGLRLLRRRCRGEVVPVRVAVSPAGATLPGEVAHRRVPRRRTDGDVVLTATVTGAAPRHHRVLSVVHAPQLRPRGVTVTV